MEETKLSWNITPQDNSLEVKYSMSSFLENLVWAIHLCIWHGRMQQNCHMPPDFICGNKIAPYILLTDSDTLVTFWKLPKNGNHLQYSHVHMVPGIWFRIFLQTKLSFVGILHYTKELKDPDSCLLIVNDEQAKVVWLNNANGTCQRKHPNGYF